MKKQYNLVETFSFTKATIKYNINSNFKQLFNTITYEIFQLTLFSRHYKENLRKIKKKT